MSDSVSLRYLLLWTGAVLIIVGVLLIAIQVGIEAKDGDLFGGRASGFSYFGVLTHYVGVMVIAFGALLDLLGFLAKRTL
jgi:hypothetical protein